LRSKKGREGGRKKIRIQESAGKRGTISNENTREKSNDSILKIKMENSKQQQRKKRRKRKTKKAGTRPQGVKQTRDEKGERNEEAYS